MSRKPNPSRYRVTEDAVVSDIDLDEENVHYHGERMTEARAEEIAARSLQEIRARNLVPGRKSLSGDGSHSPTVQYRVPTDLRERAQELAEKTGTTVSKIGRIALEEYLERHAG